MNVIWALSTAYLIAIIILFLIRAFPRTPVPIVWILASSVFACPLLVPADKVVVRALSFFPCVALWFKLTDYAREASLKSPQTFSRWLWILIPFPAVVSGIPRRIKNHRINPANVVRVFVGIAVLGTGLWLLTALESIDVLRESFPLDHIVKLLLFVVTIELLSQAAFGMEHLAGFDTDLPIRHAYRSRTVGEFWQRYNTRVHAWLYRNVFLPVGGLRHPIRGLFLAFFVSAVFHELAFAIATSRIDGYQFTFFMSQAPAVVASGWLDRRLMRWAALQAIVSRTVTITWFAVSSIFFFRGVDRVFPNFYASEPWLP